MMNNILVPTDFSHCAFEALQVAAKLAKKADATLHLVHVYEKPLAGISLEIKVDVDALRNMKAEIEEEMNRLSELDFLNGVEVVQHFIPEKAIWQIFEMESMANIDLVVMGTHGASGFKEFFIGSNAQKMIRMSPAPVFAVKDYIETTEIKDIVFASNFYGENEGNFDNIRAFVELMGAKIHLLHVVTPTNFVSTDYSLDMMEDFAIRVGLNDYTKNTYNAMSVEAGITAFSQNVGADMIAMETHGRTGLAHFFNGSIAEQVVNHLSLPFLTMHIKEEDETGTIFPEMR